MRVESICDATGYFSKTWMVFWRWESHNSCEWESSAYQRPIDTWWSAYQARGQGHIDQEKVQLLHPGVNGFGDIYSSQYCRWKKGYAWDPCPKVAYRWLFYPEMDGLFLSLFKHLSSLTKTFQLLPYLFILYVLFLEAHYW